ncbi:anaerobic sulfatase maturase [Psychromonas ossibalaenae]|uniref:anaerobic sulfatase maturase n=1 Tax=Psychromonas ossibalaenae TaxID=444922 RepID=UPI0003685C46|nr:anaerobic sulfatase maturase [Psychromonas ossibalaenae]
MNNDIKNGCHVMAKPTGSTCNLNCTYCFYLEKHKLYRESSKQFMDQYTLENYIRQHIEAQSADVVEFAWQGGEPTLAGLAFYKKAVELQKKYAGRKQIHNNLQTNGIIIDDLWCQFFKENNWLIGISIDGPMELHDIYRVNRSGKGSHQKVIKAVTLLKYYQIEFNILAVINNHNVKHPQKVYNYLKSLGTAHIQFIPLIERENRNAPSHELRLISPGFQPLSYVTSWSVEAKAYGQFLADVFTAWVEKDIGRVFIQLFDSLLGVWCGYPAQMCSFSERCGHAFALEANGDIYNCDHYVYPEHKLGNINETKIITINNSERAKQFANDKKLNLSTDCHFCPFLKVCHGGCPKHRFIASSSGQKNHNYFCEGYKIFFTRSAPYMKLMRNLINRGISPAELMNMTVQRE